VIEALDHRPVRWEAVVRIAKNQGTAVSGDDN